MNEDIIDSLETSEENRTLTHNKDTFFYSVSATCERAGYYGFRAILVLYLMDSHFAMERTEVLRIYAWLTGAYMGSKILGAVIGDLIIGSKRAIILGGILQAIGACSLMTHNIYAFYIGLFLMVLGAGLYSPNLLSSFGKSYLNKIKFLDAGFGIIYLAVNVGSFIGVLSVGYVGENYGWNFGFALTSFFSILSLMPIFLLRDKDAEKVEIDYVPAKSGVKKVVGVLIPVAFFWFVFHLATSHIFHLDGVFFDLSNWDMPRSFWSGMMSNFVYPIAIFVTILWTYFYSTQIFKLVIGFTCATLSLGLLLLIPDLPKEEHVWLYFSAMIILAVAEAYIYPVINSIAAQYINPKYLATTMTIAVIPIGLVSYVVSSLIMPNFYEDSKFLLLLALVIAGFICLGLIVYLKFEKAKDALT